MISIRKGSVRIMLRGADKSPLGRKKSTTTEDFEFRISYL